MSEIRPLSAVLHELKALVESKASGFLFLVTDENHASSVRLRNGNIEEVSFSNRHSDEAVQMLMKVKAARARFQPSVMAAIPSKHGPLSTASIDWLLSGHDATASPGAQAHTAPASGAADQRARQRPVVEKIALTYFGPIATLLCEEAFGASTNVDHILVQIASNLPEQAEADRFLAEARAAVARLG